ncbi:MAG: hypothetical protein AAF601_14070 [Pseudomonadota bacterium]
MAVVRDISIFMGVGLLGAALGPALTVVQAAAAPAQSSDGVAVVLFPAWEDPADALHRAGWHVIGPQQAPLGILAAPSPNAADSIDGAWAILRNPSLIAFCTPKENT